MLSEGGPPPGLEEWRRGDGGMLLHLLWLIA